MPFNNQQASLERLGTIIAEAPNTVVFVVGAGLSMAANIPNWHELNKRLLTVAREYQRRRKIYSAKEQDVIFRDLEREATDKPWLFGDEVVRYFSSPREYQKTVQINLTGDEAPEAYHKIWGMKPSGMISLNLDPLARLALGGDAGDCATGFQPSRYQAFLLRKRPFLLQPHGAVEDPGSWVLGMGRRNKLLKNPRYRQFIQSLLQTRRLVFVGVRPDDLALEALMLDDFRSPAEDDDVSGIEHFWILGNPTRSDRAFAQQYSISLIEYEASSGHPEVLSIFDHIASVLPRPVSTGAVYAGATISPDDLPTEEELLREIPQAIRQRLNAALRYISDNEPDHEKRLSRICTFYQDYAQAIALAWTVDTGKNSMLWGTKITKFVNHGAFGTVYRSVDVDGSEHAVKILHQRVINSPEFLEAFQRGAQALHILTDRKIPGVVRFHEAYDVPACIFMEYIDGIDFQSAVRSKRYADSLEAALLIVETVGTIVNRGHNAERQILHRDLKPANIMIRNPSNSPLNHLDPNSIVVLDFDLSWYEGAAGRSVWTGAQLHNYIAPEQISARSGGGDVSSRVPAVDVFGMGMLLYFAATREEPPLGVQNGAHFSNETEGKIASAWPGPYRFVSRYLTALVVESSNSDQRKRISLPVFISAVRECRNALESIDGLEPPVAVQEMEAILNERRWSSSDGYSLDTMTIRHLSFESALVQLSIADQKGKPRVRITLTFSDTGAALRRGLDGRLAKKADEACARLRRGRLADAQSTPPKGGHAAISCIATKSKLSLKEINSLVGGIEDATAILRSVLT